MQGSTRNVTGADVSKRRFARLQGDENTVYDKFFRWNVDSSDVIRSATFHNSQTHLPVDFCIVLGFMPEYRHSLNVTFQPTTVCGSAQLRQPVCREKTVKLNRANYTSPRSYDFSRRSSINGSLSGYEEAK